MHRDSYYTVFERDGQVLGHLRRDATNYVFLASLNFEFYVAALLDGQQLRLTPQATKDRAEALHWLDNLLVHGSFEKPD